MCYISPTEKKFDKSTVLNFKDGINIRYIANFILYGKIIYHSYKIHIL